MTGKITPVSIGFKDTASASDIIVVLNSLCMATADPALINRLKKHENIILKEIVDEPKNTK